MNSGNNIFYRVANIQTQQGLWYDQQGQFTGLIHDKFNFCTNNELKMEFDPELRGWLSATPSIEELMKWFSKEDIERLNPCGWKVYQYLAEESAHYSRFNHTVIKQSSAQVIKEIII